MAKKVKAPTRTATVTIAVAVPGHHGDPTVLTNTCTDSAEAERWAAWRERRLHDEGLDVLSVVVEINEES